MTELQQHEQALREADARFRSTVADNLASAADLAEPMLAAVTKLVGLRAADDLAAAVALLRITAHKVRT